MKIGIITFHRADNYGAVLQCYALQEVIRQWGHEVEVIDYRNSHIESAYTFHFPKGEIVRNTILLNFKAAKGAYKKYYSKTHDHAYFENFRKKYLKLSETSRGAELPQKYDVYIIGSDQMWSVDCGGGYDPIFFGQFTHSPNSRICGYAISSTGDFVKYMELDQIRKIVSSFSSLAFREHKIADLVKCITGRDTTVTIDPTLLTNSSLWDVIVDQKWMQRKYVVFYEVRAPQNNKLGVYSKAKQYAQLHNLELIDLRNGSYSVTDFVSAIKYAECVFTSSFHATVFSVIFHTPLYAFRLHDAGDNRYVNILKALQLDGNLVELASDTRLCPTYDGNKVEELLRKLRNHSEIYLKQILDE